MSCAHKAPGPDDAACAAQQGSSNRVMLQQLRARACQIRAMSAQLNAWRPPVVHLLWKFRCVRHMHRRPQRSARFDGARPSHAPHWVPLPRLGGWRWLTRWLVVRRSQAPNLRPRPPKWLGCVGFLRLNNPHRCVFGQTPLCTQNPPSARRPPLRADPPSARRTPPLSLYA